MNKIILSTLIILARAVVLGGEFTTSLFLDTINQAIYDNLRVGMSTANCGSGQSACFNNLYIGACPQKSDGGCGAAPPKNSFLQKQTINGKGEFNIQNTFTVRQDLIIANLEGALNDIKLGFNSGREGHGNIILSEKSATINSVVGNNGALRLNASGEVTFSGGGQIDVTDGIIRAGRDILVDGCMVSSGYALPVTFPVILRQDASGDKGSYGTGTDTSFGNIPTPVKPYPTAVGVFSDFLGYMDSGVGGTAYDDYMECRGGSPHNVVKRRDERKSAQGQTTGFALGTGLGYKDFYKEAVFVYFYCPAVNSDSPKTFVPIKVAGINNVLTAPI
jgi:hypothetical protein